MFGGFVEAGLLMLLIGWLAGWPAGAGFCSELVGLPLAVFSVSFVGRSVVGWQLAGWSPWWSSGWLARLID